MILRAPFPWFGGKSRAAHLIWPRLGDAQNYVEPFAGSLAVLLARPHAAKTETVNDADCYLANFWRAVQHEPDAVWQWADAPVIEADLHARHVWLLEQTDFRERVLTDPAFYDAKVAGWWVWGVSLWIGDGWCDVQAGRQAGRQCNTLAVSQVGRTGHPTRKLPELGSERGIRRDSYRSCGRGAEFAHARTHARTHANPTSALSHRTNGRSRRTRTGVPLTIWPTAFATSACAAAIGAAL